LKNFSPLSLPSPLGLTDPSLPFLPCSEVPLVLSSPWRPSGSVVPVWCPFFFLFPPFTYLFRCVSPLRDGSFDFLFLFSNALRLCPPSFLEVVFFIVFFFFSVPPVFPELFLFRFFRQSNFFCTPSHPCGRVLPCYPQVCLGCSGHADEGFFCVVPWILSPGSLKYIASIFSVVSRYLSNLFLVCP